MEGAHLKQALPGAWRSLALPAWLAGCLPATPGAAWLPGWLAVVELIRQ
jgi:hypothetical protein